MEKSKTTKLVNLHLGLISFSTVYALWNKDKNISKIKEDGLLHSNLRDSQKKYCNKYKTAAHTHLIKT